MTYKDSPFALVEDRKNPVEEVIDICSYKEGAPEGAMALFFDPRLTTPSKIWAVIWGKGDLHEWVCMAAMLELEEGGPSSTASPTIRWHLTPLQTIAGNVLIIITRGLTMKRTPPPLSHNLPGVHDQFGCPPRPNFIQLPPHATRLKRRWDTASRCSMTP